MENQTVLPQRSSSMEKLGYFITGLIAGVAGLVGAAYYFKDDEADNVEGNKHVELGASENNCTSSGEDEIVHETVSSETESLNAS